MKGWWTRPGSNRRPRECHSRALPTALLAPASHMSCYPREASSLKVPGPATRSVLPEHALKLGRIARSRQAQGQTPHRRWVGRGSTDRCRRDLRLL